jgi:hypothetical protein
MRGVGVVGWTSYRGDGCWTRTASVTSNGLQFEKQTFKDPCLRRLVTLCTEHAVMYCLNILYIILLLLERSTDLSTQYYVLERVCCKSKPWRKRINKFCDISSDYSVSDKLPTWIFILFGPTLVGSALLSHSLNYIRLNSVFLFTKSFFLGGGAFLFQHITYLIFLYCWTGWGQLFFSLN